MKSETYQKLSAIIALELSNLIQGFMIALFFFIATAIGSYSEVAGQKYLSLFEALMGHDYLVMGVLAYAILIGIAGIKYSDANLVAQSWLGRYARSLLLFPFVGFITPAIIFIILNFFSVFHVSKEINDAALYSWVLLSLFAVITYLTLCCAPYLLCRTEVRFCKGIHLALLFSALLMTVFFAEKIFFNTNYLFSGFKWFFIVFIFIVVIFFTNSKLRRM